MFFYTPENYHDTNYMEWNQKIGVCRCFSYHVGGIFRFRPLVFTGVKVGFVGVGSFVGFAHTGTWPFGGLDMVQETGSFAVF